jgi:uncharacterized protein YbjT (DUF2867 family)
MILLAGGSGRLGTLVAGRLTARGCRVRVLTRDRARAAHLAGPRVEILEGDVRDAASVAAAVDGADTVVSAIHGFSGLGGVTPASVDRDGNVNLIDAAASVGADVILVSVVGARADHPMELFRMKHAAEEHLRAAATPWTIVRSTAFLELWLDILERTAGRSGRPIVFGRGENPINFVSVSDVAALVDHVIADASNRGATLELGGPEDFTFNALANALQAATGRTHGPRHVPRPALRGMAAALTHVKPDQARQAREALAMDSVDLTYAATTVRDAHPELGTTSLGDLLLARSR